MRLVQTIMLWALLRPQRLYRDLFVTDDVIDIFYSYSSYATLIPSTPHMRPRHAGFFMSVKHAVKL